MLGFDVRGGLRPQHILCLGAHCDDIEIGCGGTIARLVASHPGLNITWVVMSSTESRAREAHLSADTLLAGTMKKTVIVRDFRDGFLPYQGSTLKDYFEELKGTLTPDLIFTHQRNDLHQDHRLLSELTWTTFRDHLILEYEIPKYDGDLGNPNIFMWLDAPTCHAKAQHILRFFRSQANKAWFREETFLALLRIRGMEANAPSGYAEAFYGRKVILA